MPELPEVEAYRRLGERALGRRVAEVVAPDAWYLKRGLTAAALAVVVAEDVVGARDDTARAAGAQARRHHLVVEVGPVENLPSHQPTVRDIRALPGRA